MKTFPETLNVNNKEKFPKIFYDRMICYLRRDIHEYMISRKDENEYFSVDEFNQVRVKDLDSTKKMMGELIKELESLGWNCKTSYGGTGLFVYSTKKPPASCWEETEEFS